MIFLELFSLTPTIPAHLLAIPRIRIFEGRQSLRDTRSSWCKSCARACTKYQRSCARSERALASLSCHPSHSRGVVHSMARLSNQGASRSAWAWVFFLLAVLACPLLLAGSARAQDSTQQPLGDKGVSGPIIGIDLGTTYS